MAALKLNQTNCPTNNNEVIRNALNLYKDRETNLNSLFKNIVYFFKKPDRDTELESKYINEVSRKNIKALVDSLECIKWQEDDINQCIKDFVKNNGLKFPEIAMPLRVRLVGNLNTPNIGSIIFVLGFDELKERVNDCL